MQPATVPALSLPIYVWCMGQDDNIGDVVLRRRLLNELRPLGHLHVFLGDAASDAFVAALAPGSDDIIVRDSSAWTRSVLDAAAKGPILCVGKPGELPTDFVRLGRSLRRLLLYWRVKRNKGVVVQLGIGAREQPRRLMPLFRMSFGLHDLVRWRDPRSHAHFRLGAMMPDWGFDDHGLPGPAVEDDVGTRDTLVVSLRGDRPLPARAWMEGVQAFCGEVGLRPLVVTQVRRDAERNRELASLLDSGLIDWESEPHAAQERRLRTAYGRSALVLSDRLHVLIVALTEGAVPLCMLDRPEDKIGRHFDAIGYAEASIDVTSLSSGQVVQRLMAALGREAEAKMAKARATEMIADVGRELRELVQSRVHRAS
jgi:hypothetical protein